MKITKEMLESNGIKNFIIKVKDKSYLAVLTGARLGKWTFRYAELDIFNPGKAKIIVKFKNGEKSEISSEITTADANYCEMEISNTETITPLNQLSVFYKFLDNLESNEERYGRRKEERYEISRETECKLNLETRELQVYLSASKIVLPCAMKDFSLHGMCIICPDTSALDYGETFIIRLLFKNPAESILVKGHKVFYRKKAVGEKIYAYVSLQLLEPIHFGYKSRIYRFLSDLNIE